MKEISTTGVDISTMCRLCLSSGVTVLDLFSFSTRFDDLVANVIMKCAPVQIRSCDEMPNVICQKCCTKLERTHQFQLQIVQSEKTLQRYLEQLHVLNQRPSKGPLIDKTKADITVKCESVELHDVLSDLSVSVREEECGNFNSALKIDLELPSKSKIKHRQISDNSSIPEDCAGNIVKTSAQDCKGTDISVEDSQLEVGRFANFISACGSNEQMTTKIEIKDEQMDDNSLISVESADNTLKTLFEDGGGEISFEDSKIDTGDMFVEDADVNWKQNESADLHSARKNIEKIYLKSEIKEEPIDSSSILTDCLNGTVNDFSKADSENSFEDTKIDFENLEKESKNTWIERKKDIETNEVKPQRFNSNQTCSSRLSGCKESILKTHKSAYECNICNKSFTKASRLNNHKLTHSDEKPYQCDVCSKCFIESRKLKYHKRIHTGEKPYKCEVCKMCFTTSGSLNTHNMIHTGEKPYKCDVCKKCFTTSTNLNIHNMIHTGEKPHECEVCSKRFIASKDLKNHKLIHTGEKPYKCDVCEKCFTQLSNLNRHKRVHTGERPYKCDVCNKYFSTSGNLKTHHIIHTGEKPYQCNVCNKCFIVSADLNRHKRKHTDEKPYTCAVCEKCFSTSGSLNIHNLMHTGEKPYQCDVCNKCFITSKDLEIHKRIHTGEKPFKCDVCEKCFTQLINLNRHKRIHTGEKPYKCDVCNKYFTTSSNLKNHKMIHTGEKPYQCDVCNKRFIASQDLTVHKRIHTGEKPYKCDLCKKCFTHSGNLKSHKRIHTNEKQK